MDLINSIKIILKKIIKKTSDYGILVMFSHTIFSLSFALISLLIASGGRPEPETLFWIMVAFMGARTGANAINRVIDASIDAKNPRTAERQIPQGKIKKKEVIGFTIVCFAVMVFGAGMLNTLCLILSPIAIFLMVIYSYTKRFTWTCHLILGITSAAAPVGAWIAVTGQMGWIPFFMGATNTLWVAGFDIIYGAQDVDFDRANGLHSIPERFGIRNALNIARLFHFGALCALVVVGILAKELSTIYFAGIGIIAALFILEHSIVSPERLTNVKVASYNINQVISIVFLSAGLIDCLI